MLGSRKRVLVSVKTVPSDAERTVSFALFLRYDATSQYFVRGRSSDPVATCTFSSEKRLFWKVSELRTTVPSFGTFTVSPMYTFLFPVDQRGKYLV